MKNQHNYWQLYKSTGNNPLIVHTAVLTQCHTRLLYHCLTTCVTYVYFQTFYEDFFIGLRRKSPPLPEIFTVPYYTMILQRPSVIVEDAAFEPRTSAPRSLMRYHWATTSHNCFKIYFLIFFMKLPVPLLFLKVFFLHILDHCQRVEGQKWGMVWNA